MQNTPQQTNNQNPVVYVVDTSIPRNQDFMGRVLGRIIGHVNKELWKNRNGALYVYGKGSAYPIRVVAELPMKDSGFEELTLAYVMPGILGDKNVTVNLNPPEIERLGLDPARLEEIVAFEAQGVRDAA